MALATVGPLRFSVVLVHTGLFVVNTGAAGAGFTTTFCVAVPEVHPFTTTYREYTPLMAAVAEARTGSSTLPGFHPPGPDHT